MTTMRWASIQTVTLWVAGRSGSVIAGRGGDCKALHEMGPIEKVAAKVFPGVPVTPMQETFGTDSNRLTSVGIPTYGFSGLFRGDDAGNIHGLNEHISVQSVIEGRQFLYQLIKAYADQK